MKLKKGLLTLFYKVLSEGRTDIAKDHISLADARVRDQLATKTLFDLLHEFEEARKKIYLEFCVKDSNKEPVYLEGNYQFKPSVVEEMTKEVKILEEEEVEIKIENPTKILMLMENTKYEPRVGDTIAIDEIIKNIAESVAPKKQKDAK